MQINWNNYIKFWYKVATEPSGNFTSNLSLDQDLLDKLMENNITDEYFYNKVSLFEKKFPELECSFCNIKGINILAGLQNLHMVNCITVYRAIRFPTPMRIINIVQSS